MTHLKQRCKANFVRALLIGILALAVSQLCSAQGTDCSSLIAGRTYAGAFSGFLNIGTLVPNGGAQYLHFNTDGTVAGSGTFGIGIEDPQTHAPTQNFTNAPVTGSYGVDWNSATSTAVCSGWAKVDAHIPVPEPNGSDVHHEFQLVVTGEGSSIEFIDKDFGLTMGFTAEPIQEGRCSVAMLNSTYTYNAKGWIVPPFPMPTVSGLIPLAFSGAVTFDGAGNTKGWDMVSLNGLIVPRTYSGTYSFDLNGPNCVATGLATDNMTPPNVMNTETFVLRGAKGIVVVNTDVGTVLSFTAKR